MDANYGIQENEGDERKALRDEPTSHTLEIKGVTVPGGPGTQVFEVWHNLGCWTVTYRNFSILGIVVIGVFYWPLMFGPIVGSAAGSLYSWHRARHNKKPAALAILILSLAAGALSGALGIVALVEVAKDDINNYDYFEEKHWLLGHFTKVIIAMGVANVAHAIMSFITAGLFTRMFMAV